MKLIYSIYKEYKILIRDKAGLAIMFLMPVALIIIITLIQDSTFRSVNEASVPVLIVDRDNDSLSMILEKSLLQSKFFSITKKQLTDDEAKQEIALGHYFIGIIIPKNTSTQLREKTNTKINILLKSFSGDSTDVAKPLDTTKVNLQLYFDPITKKSFKTTITNSIERIVSQIEMQSMVNSLYQNMQENFPLATPSKLELSPIVNIKEEYASYNNSSIIPNSVQHNVPAWTLFAMFFICIPLAGNIIKERNDGSAFRLLTMPGSYLIVLLGKIFTFLCVNILQFILMLCVGVFILPMLGLPQLILGNNLIILFTVAFSSGIAATSFGLLVGTVSSSHDQASLFGALFVIILAAIGGVWVPTFVMPEMMKKLAVISPLNWGLEAFYAVFIRSSGFKEIFSEIIKLILFSTSCIIGAFLFQKYNRQQ